MNSKKHHTSSQSEAALENAITKWQKSIDLLSELMHVPAALIMRYEDEYMEVFVSSDSTNNPYQKGDKEKCHGLYCETVIKSQKKLLVPNATKDAAWDKNPDIKLGMISYLGFPINYPDATPFGTICVLDNKENNYSDTYEKLLVQYKEIIEQDLLLLQSLSNSLAVQTEDFNFLLRNNLVIKDNNKIYQRLFESANAAILIIAADFRIIDCNATASRLLERPKHEILGITPADSSITPKHQPNGELSVEMGMEHFSSAMKDNDLCFDWVHLKRDGTEFPVEISLFGFTASNKKNFFAMWKDLTEVKRKENELKESEERFRTIFSNGTDGVVLHTPDIQKGITHCNEAAYKILGYSSKEGILGKNILDISPLMQSNGLKTIEIAKIHLTECLEKGKTRFEWIHLKKDGSPIWFDIVLTRITFLDEVYIHSLWRDITEVKRYQGELLEYQNLLEEMVTARTSELEEALKNLKDTQAKLIQSEKMASLGVLTSGVAHEINNPLNFILGSYTGLVEYFEENSIKNEDISILLSSLKIGFDRAANIVKGLDQFSRNQESMDEVCNIHAIIDNCLLMVNNQLENQIGIIKNYSREQFHCNGNGGKLHQVFINILNNACQAIVKNGTITINTIKTKKMFRIDISDTGVGISKVNLSKITDPFFTTKDPGKGTGLGLSITYSIVKEHNGNLEFESIENKGTTVKITLPLKENKNE